MLGSDSESSAWEMSRLFDDPRVHQYWDAKRSSGEAYSVGVFPNWLSDMASSMPADHQMGSLCRSMSGRDSRQSPMWDFAAFYPAGVRWGDSPPEAAGWSKQVAYYGTQPSGETGTFWRDDFTDLPIESDRYAKIQEQMNRLMGSARS